MFLRLVSRNRSQKPLVFDLDNQDSNSNQDDAVRVDKGPIFFSDGSCHSELFDHIAKFDAESKGSFLIIIVIFIVSTFS